MALAVKVPALKPSWVFTGTLAYFFYFYEIVLLRTFIFWNGHLDNVTASCYFFTSSDSQTGKTNPMKFLTISIYWNLTHLTASLPLLICNAFQETNHHQKSPLKWLSSPFVLTAWRPYCPPPRYTSSFVHTEVKPIWEKTAASIT